MTELSQLPTAREMVIRLQGEKAIKSSLSLYENEISNTKTNFPISDNELGIAHQEAYEKAVENFKKEASVESDDQLNNELKEPFQEFSKKIALWLPIATKIGTEYLQVNKLVSGSLLELYNLNTKRKIFVFLIYPDVLIFFFGKLSVKRAMSNCFEP